MKLLESGGKDDPGEVKRNKPDLCKTLDKVDCINIKWGKKFLFIIVGE